MWVIIDVHLVSEVNGVNVLAGMMRVRGGGTSYTACSGAVEEQECESRVEKHKREEKEGKIDCSEYISTVVIERSLCTDLFGSMLYHVCACWWYLLRVTPLNPLARRCAVCINTTCPLTTSHNTTCNSMMLGLDGGIYSVMI